LITWKFISAFKQWITVEDATGILVRSRRRRRGLVVRLLRLDHTGEHILGSEELVLVEDAML
jgi:hypothetical protein